MKNIKKHKKIIWIVIIAVILVLMLWYVKDLLYPNDSKSVYGNRLDGIENVPIKEDLKTDVINFIKATNQVKSVSIDIRGRIINILIDIKKDVDITTAKNIANSVLSKFSDKQKNFYDMQFFLSQNDVSDNKSYPIIGYKVKTNNAIVWSGI